MLTEISSDNWKKLIAKEIKLCDRATISMWRCAEHSRMPPSHSLTSFGIDSLNHVLAIKWCIDKRHITPKKLDDARKNGIKISKLICVEGNPHKVVFATIWDLM